MATLSEALSIAIAHHQAGRLEPAEGIYRQILAAEPEHADAWHLLGVIAHQRGQPDTAVEQIVRAIALRPTDARYHNNLGEAYRAAGRNAEAIACYRRAVELAPDYVVAHNNLGGALRAEGNLVEAIASYRRALAANPAYAEAWNNLGNAWQDLGKLDEAVDGYRRAIELAPQLAETHCNLGLVLQQQGKPVEALACCQRALELKPELAEAHSNLGSALRALGRLDEAVACHLRALDLKADWPQALSNLASALKDQAMLDEAVACYRHAVELNPDDAAIQSSLVCTLHFSPAYDGQAILAAHRLWDLQHAVPRARFIAPHANDRRPDRRLRVGYVSPDFRHHAQANFTVPLLSAHDHRDFEIFCYADVARPDDVTGRLRSSCDVWRDIAGLGEEQAAGMIRQDQIDILVDLTMHMAGNRLPVFAHKPAPVQVCWLAYPGTTGLSTIDYRLTDRYLDPPGLHDNDYTEQSIRLGDAFWCYDPLATGPAVNRLPALENGNITFASLNNYCKVNPSLLRLWAQVLRRVDRARLVLMAAEGSHRQRALDQFQQEGVAADRVTFILEKPRAEYLALYQEIDLCLDTFPYNGHTTSLDCLWMGVPVVTLVGQTAVGRGGLSILSNLGLPELAAEDADQYVRIAVALANDRPRLAELRRTLRDRLQKSPLMDAPRFARNIEAAYREMWRRWCAREG